MNTNQRIERLERMNRVWATLALGSLCVLGVVGFAREPASELVTDRLVIGHRDGVPRLVIEQDADRVLLSIEHPDDADAPLLHIGSGADGAWVAVGESMLAARASRREHSFVLGGWSMRDSMLSWGSAGSPIIELGVRSNGAFANFADADGFERVAVEIYEPWDNPGTTEGGIVLSSDHATSRLSADDAALSP